MGLIDFIRRTLINISTEEVPKLDLPYNPVPSEDEKVVNYHDKMVNHVNFGNSKVITKAYKRKRISLDDKRTDFYDGDKLHGC